MRIRKSIDSLRQDGADEPKGRGRPREIPSFWRCSWHPWWTKMNQKQYDKLCSDLSTGNLQYSLGSYPRYVMKEGQLYYKLAWRRSPRKVCSTVCTCVLFKHRSWWLCADTCVCVELWEPFSGCYCEQQETGSGKLPLTGRKTPWHKQDTGQGVRAVLLA